MMEQKKVRDLMLPLNKYATIHGDKTVREALLVLKQAQMNLNPESHVHRAVLVLDDSGRVVGKLSQWAILRSLEPKFLEYEDEASLARAGLTHEFIQSLKETFSLFNSGLDPMCRAAGRIKAKDVMVPIGESIDADALLTEAIHQMVLKHVLSILVVHESSVVGILRQSDVFEEVADIIRASDA
jgi:CBS domain-containing protein